jgi:DNA processing protein
MKINHYEIYLYYLGFSHFLGIGPVRMKALLSYFDDVKKAYFGSKEDIRNVIGDIIGQRFCLFRDNFDLEKKAKELENKQIFMLFWEDNKYPKELLNISDPPICLYCRGDIDLLSGSSVANSPIFAIVGTRNPSIYGAQIAKKISSELATAGFTIVSGMALGIDAIAHRGALDVNGKTIAVLGCGVDIIYPAYNRFLYNQIVEKGVVISEFPPGKTVEKGLFISRNRIISGLSKGVLVVEGQDKSGALISARYAGEQGKEVFAIPGPITSSVSSAPNFLIKQGAKMVTTVEDIYEELNIKIKPRKKEEIEKLLNEMEKIIFQSLQEKPLSTDDLIGKTTLPTARILNTLSQMELKGIIEKNSEGKYQIRLL